MQFEQGRRFGPYEIVSLIGIGGMGQVYRAKDLQLGREVAIKFLTEEAAGNQDRLRRFIAEAKAASALNHPNILTVYTIGEEDHHPYLITELVDGVTLRKLLAQGPLPVGRAIEIAIQTLAGLSKAHSIGIVHRDLKPENLMITKDGFVKILDFGLAKLLKENIGDLNSQPMDSLGLTATESGFIAGTAAYMSPEQARGQRVDYRSDVFSLGVILYEMITGKNPFQRNSAMDTISAILRDQPASISELFPAAGSGLDSILQKSLQKDPEERYASARSFESELEKTRRQLDTQNEQPTREFQPNFTEERPTLAGTTVQVPRSIWKSAWLILPVLLIPLALVVFGIRHYNPHPSMQASGPPVVAVMAIENKTADKELAQADVGRILSDAFLQILYDIKGVQIVSPLRVDSIISELKRSYVETSRDLELVQEICRRSNANTILSGSLSQIGDTYILNATLTELPSERLVGKFEARAKGKGSLLESITSGIAPNLKQTLAQRAGAVNMAGGRKIGEVMTDSFSAYTHYVRGHDFMNEGKWLASVDELNKALAIDPNMGIAWSDLACAYSFAGDQTRSGAAGKKALELKSRMTRKEQLWVDSNSRWFDGNGEAYRAAMQKYTNEFPDDRMAYFYIGLSWEWLDHNPREAIKWYEKAYRLTPGYYPVTKALVDCYLEADQKNQAIAALQRYMDKVRSGYGYQQAKQRLSNITATAA